MVLYTDMQSVYSIVAILPAKTQEKIREWYHQTYNRSITLKHLHLSLLFSFSNEKYSSEDIVEILQLFQFQPFVVKVEKVVLYSMTELPIATLTFDSESKARLDHFHFVLEKHMKLNFNKALEYDVSKFIDGVVPEYDPHVSLEYNIEKDVATKIETIEQSGLDFAFTISQNSLYLFEQNDGKLSEHVIHAKEVQDVNTY